MQYEGIVYRPPSEAKSLILQLTVGCSHNKCIFCDMYRDKNFRVRSWEDFKEDIAEAKRYYPEAERIFLADGNVLCIDGGLLIQVLEELYRQFPYLSRVAAYAGPKDLLDKSDEELLRIRKAGLEILYLGVETGSDRLLKFINKGVSAHEMIEAGRKAKKTGFTLSVTVISGIGGTENWEMHARETAQVLNAIDPEYLGLLTLMLRPNTPLERLVEKGKFHILSPEEVMMETMLLLQELHLTNCVFRSNHISNYLPLAGTLSKDKERLLQQIENAMKKNGKLYRPEFLRHL